jgi:tetratricopeptide (TPR) repeat protein
MPRRGEPIRAAEWYQRAGQQARATYTPGAAIEYYEQALDCLPENGGLSQAAADRLPGTGRDAALAGALCRSQRALSQTAFATAVEAGDPLVQSRALERMYWIQEAQGDMLAALATAAAAEAKAREAGAAGRPYLVNALYIKGWASYRLGEAEAALALGREALALGTAIDARREQARALNLLGSVETMLGHYQDA